MDCGICWSRMNKVFIKLWTKCFFNYPICLRAPVFLRITTKTYYLITWRPGNRPLSSSSKWLCFLLIHRRVKPQEIPQVSFVTHYCLIVYTSPPSPLFHLELSSKIRSSLLYFAAAITFERFKTFCLRSSRAETETFTRERDLIPIGVPSNRIRCQRKDSDEAFPTTFFNESSQLIIQILKMCKQ